MTTVCGSHRYRTLSPAARTAEPAAYGSSTKKVPESDDAMPSLTRTDMNEPIKDAATAAATLKARPTSQSRLSAENSEA